MQLTKCDDLKTYMTQLSYRTHTFLYHMYPKVTILMFHDLSSN